MSSGTPSKRVEQKIASLTRQFFANHPDVKLVAVTGSAGKASTKLAIATLLSKQYNVQLREQGPVTKTDVFLQIMGVMMPESGFFRWRKVIKALRKRVEAPQSGVHVIVQEFDPREIGYNGWFRQYLVPDLTVVTSVQNGRMEVDYPVEAVAQEMITLANNSRAAIINRDDVDGRFASFLTNPHITTYGSTPMAEYRFDQHKFTLAEGYKGVLITPEDEAGIPLTVRLIGEHNLRPSMAAVAVADSLGMDKSKIAEGIEALRPLPGRMNILPGADGSWLIDDSYSSTPSTALAALQMLYSIEAPQRIAVLGNMNGLKGVYEVAHADLGSRCSPDLLDWVVTVGAKANQHLAPAARKRGCQVKECIDAVEAGAFVRGKLMEDGIALFKGSSGGVWLEEAIKLNLSSLSDESQLVRQDDATLDRKKSFFTSIRG